MYSLSPYNGFGPGLFDEGYGPPNGDGPAYQLPPVITTVPRGPDIFDIKPHVITTERPEIQQTYTQAPTVSAFDPKWLLYGAIALGLLVVLSGKGHGSRSW